MCIYSHIQGVEMQIKTPDQVKQDFENSGKSIASWASKHGFRETDVYKVLNGQSRYKRGIGHQIAVALGIKSDKQSQTTL